MPLTIRTLALAATALAIAGLSGCSQGRQPPEKTTVTVVNAAPTAGTVDFLRVRRVEATLSYRGTSGRLVFDEDQYDFNVETTRPGATQPVQLGTFSMQVMHGTDYLFVLTEDGGSVVPVVVEKPVFESTTEAEVGAVHAAPSQPPLDFYLTAPGADIASAAPLAGLQFEQAATPATVEAGDYVLTVTAAGDPADVLFTSTTLTLNAGESTTFVVAADTGAGIVPFTVVAAGPQPGVLIDKNAKAGVEVVNAAADGAARDVYLDADYGAPLLAAVPSPAASATAIVPPGARTLNVTPAGDTGVVEVEHTFTAVRGIRQTELVAGEPGTLEMIGLQDDAQFVAGEARVRFMDAATLFEALDVYIVPPGTDVTTVFPVVSLTQPAITQRIAIPPGQYDLVVRDPATSTIVAGPQDLTVDEGVFSILLTNGATSGTVDAVFLQGFD